MQSNFDDLCKSARENIKVPAIPLAAIRSGMASEPVQRSRRSWTPSVAAALAGTTLLAAVAGAAVWSGTHVKVDPNTGVFVVRAQKMTSLESPTLLNLPAFVSHASFPVILPAGLPAGTTVASARMFGSSAVMVQYNLPGAWRRSDHIFAVMIAGPDTVDGSLKVPPPSYNMTVGRKGPGAFRWVLGRETLFGLSSTITPAELARVKKLSMEQSR